MAEDAEELGQVQEQRQGDPLHLSHLTDDVQTTSHVIIMLFVEYGI